MWMQWEVEISCFVYIASFIFEFLVRILYVVEYYVGPTSAWTGDLPYNPYVFLQLDYFSPPFWGSTLGTYAFKILGFL